MQKNVLVAMSGGVDSTVTALLLKEAGYACHGITMRLSSTRDIAFGNTRACTDPEEILLAEGVAKKLGIPFEILDCSEEFLRHVIDYFVKSYLHGETPNPCIECNRKMKFGLLLQKAKETGCEKIATGHYATVTRSPSGRYELHRAKDPSKDQTYVLWSLTQDQLSRVLFPLGNLSKSEVREIASEHGFSNASRRDSQDICFIPDGDYAAFIERYTNTPTAGGYFLDASGQVLGTHKGALRYTTGQRKGLGIALGAPAYVLSKDIERNTVTLGTNEELFSRTLTAKSINLIATDRLDSPTHVSAKIRYGAEPAPATVEQTSSDTFTLHFDTPQRAITKGQSVVLYDGDLVLGGGVID